MDFKIPRFVKWAGGKLQLLDQIQPFLPKKIDRYFEPFVGGGAMALFILTNYEPKEIFLSDINEELINTYLIVRDDVEGLIVELAKHSKKHLIEDKEKRLQYYKSVRELKPEDLSNLQRASRFIYLNRTCFNGLYRVNSKNQFNVPIGDYKQPNIIREDVLRVVSALLKKTHIKVMPFENIIGEARKGDFIYLDPPYFPLNKNSFTTYTKDNFLEEGQTKLKVVFDKLNEKGCLIMESNSGTKFINELYHDRYQESVRAKRMINSKASGRNYVNEVIITNYKMDNSHKSEKEKLFDSFMKNLKPSIKVWDYFVNWDKVNVNFDKVKIELNLLNSLLDSNNLEKDFINLIMKYPSVVKILPILLAVRDSELKIINNYENQDLSFETFDFRDQETIDDKLAKKYFRYLENTKLISLFSNKKIRNFADYVLGVEVGLDSNGRKNRGGTLMEDIVEVFIKKFSSEHEEIEYLSQATPNRIQIEWGYEVKFDKSARSFDFAIYNKTSKKIFLIETNFYNGGGSKLKSVCGEFANLFNELQKQNIELIWITDGEGWRTTKRPLEETFKNNNHVLNLEMLENDILANIVL